VDAITIEKLKAKHFKVLQSIANLPLSGKDILEKILGLSDQSKNRHTYIKSLMDLELIEWTEPENPISKTQAYRITEKGRNLIEQAKVQNQLH
jgi:DNA-binding MarR family transcriptional regulator